MGSVFRLREFELGEQLFGGAGFTRQEILMTFPDCRPDLRVANIAFVLMFVWRELPDNGDDTSGRLDFEFRPLLKPALRRAAVGTTSGSLFLTTTVIGMVVLAYNVAPPTILP